MNTCTDTTKPRQITTQELALKFNVKVKSVSDSNSKFGYYKGYEQVGKGKRNVRLWEFVGL